MNVRLCHWFSNIKNWIYCNLNSWRSEKHTSGYNNLSHKSHTTKQCHWTFGLVGCRQRNLSCSFWLVCNLRDPLIRGSRWHQGYVSGPSFLHRGDLERSKQRFSCVRLWHSCEQHSKMMETASMDTLVTDLLDNQKFRELVDETSRWYMSFGGSTVNLLPLVAIGGLFLIRKF